MAEIIQNIKGEEKLGVNFRSDKKIKPILTLVLLSSAVLIFTCGCIDSGNGGEAGTGVQTQAATSPGNPGTTDSITEKPTATGKETPKGDIPSEEMKGSGTLPEGMGGPDIVSAAQKLGVTEDELIAALGDMGEGKQPDLESAASELGVSVEELEEALGFNKEMPPGGAGGAPTGQP